MPIIGYFGIEVGYRWGRGIFSFLMYYLSHGGVWVGVIVEVYSGYEYMRAIFRLQNMPLK